MYLNRFPCVINLWIQLLPIFLCTQLILEKENLFLKNKDYMFGHGVKYELPDKKILIGSYHPSPRNVNTKRINLNKMVKLLKNAKKIII